MEDVSPVPLAVYEQILLSQLHQGIPDGSVSVRMELHGMSHDVGHLVVAPVVHTLHGVQDAALYRFETVVDVGHGPFENHVRGIIQKPILVHPAQVVCNAVMGICFRLVIGVCIVVLFRRFRSQVCQLVFVFAHICL